MSSAIELQYAEVYGITHKKADSRQRFLSKVVEKVNKTSDDDWDQLTADAQRWFNAAFKIWDDPNNEADIPDFPDIDGHSENDDGGDQGSDAADEAGDREDNMATRGGKKRVAKKAVAKKAAAPAAKKKVVHAATNGQLATSGSSILKRAMLKDMSMSTEALAKLLKSKDYPLSPVRIDIVRAEFRNTIRLLQEDGKLKDRYDF